MLTKILFYNHPFSAKELLSVSKIYPHVLKINKLVDAVQLAVQCGMSKCTSI
jgi:hypothetical protein